MRAFLINISWMFIISLLSLVFSGCGGSKEALVIPEDLPEICRGIDFNDQVDMREVCGVKTMSSRRKGYQNIPQSRYLNLPKNAQLVKRNDKVELRLPNTIPIDMPDYFSTKIEWSEAARLIYIKDKMEYQEFRDQKNTRHKIFKLTIPFKDQTSEDFCFQVPIFESKTERSATTRGNKLNHLNCIEFDRLIKKYISK